jgi:hypothetical protein
MCGVWVWLALAAAAAQDSAVERQWPYPAELVKKNLERLHASEGSRLPTLEGFVAAKVQNPDLYEQPYYQYRVTVTPVDAKNCVVHVEAKITALFANTHTAHSEYKTLPSNGRLEADLLAHLEKALPSVASNAGTSAVPVASPARPTPDSATVASTHTAVGIGSAPAASSSVTAERNDVTSTSEQELDQVLAKRREIQEKSADLRKQVQEVKVGGSTVQDVHFASVLHSGVGVMSRTNYGGPVLFRAQADDEFEVVEAGKEWTKVKLAGGGTGWIESDELALPDSVLPAAGVEAAAAQPVAVNASPKVEVSRPNQSADTGFWISREEVATFSGDWARLHGKPVLYVYAQPRGFLSDIASDDKKLAYARQIFEARLRKAAESATRYEGVVVIFMGSKGGVAAATLGDIRQWVNGGIDERAFMNRCSLDLPGQMETSKNN